MGLKPKSLNVLLMKKHINKFAQVISTTMQKDEIVPLEELTNDCP